MDEINPIDDLKFSIDNDVFSKQCLLFYFCHTFSDRYDNLEFDVTIYLFEIIANPCSKSV